MINFFKFLSSIPCVYVEFLRENVEKLLTKLIRTGNIPRRIVIAFGASYFEYSVSTREPFDGSDDLLTNVKLSKEDGVSQYLHLLETAGNLIKELCLSGMKVMQPYDNPTEMVNGYWL